jgi:hypothetical protein
MAESAGGTRARRAASPKPGLPEECDIIMRGGATSGVIYPGVLLALSRFYRFRNIGGASAGAIAAGVAAAAEYGRRTGARPDAFETVVAGLPDELGGIARKDGRLGTDFQTLFRPAPSLEPVMDIGWAILKKADWSRQVLAFAARLVAPVLRPALATTAAAALIAGILGFVMVGAVAAPLSAAALLVALILGLATALLVAIITLALLVWQDRHGVRAALLGPVDAVARNGFGICPGVNPALGPEATTADYVQEGGFADWMHATIQRAAGREVRDLPLLMGELWGSDDAWGPPGNGGRAIDLMLTTTNLSQQLPHQFPFLERAGSILWFAEEDLRPVLPSPVVDYLVGLHDQDGPDRTGGRRAFYANGSPMLVGGRRYYRLPIPQDMPVMLGVRLSMSFPGLISAVRLHESAAWEERRGTDIADTLRPCWFSDGGITSNFPVRTFDAPLPTRPTFCINLASLPPRGDRAGTRRILLATDNSRAIRAPHRANPADLPGFAGTIVDTARNGHENELMTMPGQRDRIVTILLDPAREGGLNLEMDGQTIRRLACLGLKAGRMLAERFRADGPGEGMGWANHRWLRLRVALAGMEGLLVRFDEGWRGTHADGLSYSQVLARARVRAAPSYQWQSKTVAEEAAARVTQLRDAAESLAAAAGPRPERTIFNGIRAHRQDRGSLSRTGGAPQPAMGFQLVPLGRDPRKG